MKTASAREPEFQQVLERKQSELARITRKRDDIAIEKSADQMDETQHASERDLAIRNVDRDSRLLRQVKASLRRIHNGSFGTCIDCDGAIALKRLVAVPWAARCIECEAGADQGRPEITDSATADLVSAP